MRELVERAQHGDATAFDRIVALTSPSLHRLAAAILGRLEAADVTQDVLLTAWRELPRLRDASRFEAWLHRILVNRCRNELRRTGRRPVVVSLAAHDAERSLEVQDDTWSAVARHDALERALGRLSVDERAILALHYLADLSLPEVAVRVGIPLGTAKSRLHAGLSTMRAALGERPA